jgi:hypothetical protein
VIRHAFEFRLAIGHQIRVEPTVSIATFRLSRD